MNLDTDISEYNYPLEDNKIAAFPLSERDSSKLLVYQNKQISDRIFNQISQLIPTGSLLVFNNTKVIHARIHFNKDTGGIIELFLLKPHSPNDYSEIFKQKQQCSWLCLVGNLKKWKTNEITKIVEIDGVKINLKATKNFIENSFIIHFRWDDDRFSFAEILLHAGTIPIPPYLNRISEEIDKDRYQTIYSKFNGSVAAPTAGLHFTQRVFDDLKKNHVLIDEITLHVGAGTFVPVKSSNYKLHEMHTEHFTVSVQSLNYFIDNQFIIPVGTTSLRTLESIYWLGVKVALGQLNMHLEQWEYNELPQDISKKEALTALINYANQQSLKEISCSTRIMIIPGYQFRMIKALITNFHQAQSTLLLLVAALIGDEWKKVYQHAIASDYRFLSYGDSSILFS